MFELPLPKGQTITQIIHLADIHIRQGDMKRSRFDEYEKVIRRLVDQLRQLPSVQNGTAVTAIMGDILDHKVILTASGCALFHFLINSISELTPVYILQGNHDFQQGLPDEPGLLDSLLLSKPPNVIYLNRTGHYIAGELGIGVACVRDIHKMGYGTGYLEELPNFPPGDKFPEHIKTRLAFVHATISGCRLQNYSSEQRGLPIDWISGYDACLLGDIHLSQVHNASLRLQDVYDWPTNQPKMVWAYPGSLIQQGMGENAYDVHGYLIWDIPNKLISTHNVSNEYAMVTVRYNIKNQHWEIQVRKDWLPLIDNISQFKSLKIRIVGLFESMHLLELQNLLRDRGIRNEVVRGLVNKKAKLDDPAKTTLEKGIANAQNSAFENYNNPDAWIEYLLSNSKLDKTKLNQHKWQDWLKNPLSLQISEADVDPSLYETIQHRNKVIRVYIAELEESLKSFPPKVKINFKHLTWQWLFCYGENSWISFDKMDGKVCIVNAPNSHGKSALFDIICLAIFGQATPLRRSSENLLCKQKPEGTAAKTQLLLEIDDQKYCLIRTFNRKKNNSIQSNCIIYKEKDGTYYEYLGDSSSNKWIKNNIGELSDFILSTMVTQNTQEDFFNLNNTKQIEYLDLALNQIPYTNLLNLFKEVKNALTQIESKQEAVVAGYTKNITKIDEIVEDKTRIAHTECVAEIAKLETSLKEVQKNIRRDPIYTSEVNDVVLAAFIKAHESKLLPEKERDKDPINNLAITRVAYEKVKDYYIKTFVPDSTDKRVTVEPQAREADIKLEEQLLKEWRSKYASFKYDSQNKDKLELNLRLIEEYDREYLLLKRTELSGTYEEYQQKYLEALEQQKELIEICGKYQLIVPNVPEDLNQDKYENLENEIKSLSAGCDWQNTCFNEHFITLEKAISETNISAKKVSLAIQKLGDIKEPAKLPVVGKPALSKNRVEKWLENHAQMKERYEDKQTQWDARKKRLEGIKANRSQHAYVITEIKNLEEKIGKIRDEKLPHNPDCWACKLQPWKVHLQQEEEVLSTMKTLLQEVDIAYSELRKDDNDEFSRSAQELEDWLINFRRNSCEEENYANLLAEWIDFNKYEVEYKEYEERRTSYLESKDIIIKLQNNLRDITNELSKLEREMNVMKTCRDNRDRWLETRKAIEECKIQWKIYHEAKIYHDRLSNVNKIIGEKQDWDSHNRWVYLKTELTLCRETVKNCLEHEKMKEIYDQESVIWKSREEILFKNKQLLEKFKEDTQYNFNMDAYYLQAKLIELENQVEWLHWSKIKENRVELNNEANMLKELEKLRLEKDKLLVAETIQSNASKSYKTQCEQLLKYDTQLKAIRDKQKAIVHLMELFTEFKYWVYSTKIIPSVLLHTNDIANLITNERVGLNARVNADMDIDWLISSDGIDTMFSYGGGFDKFLFGFAIRLAIARIGACRVISKQLFIDEGFVAADQDHLELVPSLLDNLLDIYPTILLVTHIQSLKNEQYENIPIIRKQRISAICYGDKESVKISKSYENYNKETIAETSDEKTHKSQPVKLEAESAFDPNKCHGKTAKGTQCTNKKKDGDYCGKHSKKIIES